MFALSSKHRLSAGFKNDAIGVWYDAKTNVTQTISKLKIFVKEKGISLLNQTFKPTAAYKDTQYSKANFSEMIHLFEEEMISLKR